MVLITSINARLGCFQGKIEKSLNGANYLHQCQANTVACTRPVPSLSQQPALITNQARLKFLTASLIAQIKKGKRERTCKRAK
jgi:hypothetical protein